MIGKKEDLDPQTRSRMESAHGFFKEINREAKNLYDFDGVVNITLSEKNGVHIFMSEGLDEGAAIAIIKNIGEKI